MLNLNSKGILFEIGVFVIGSIIVLGLLFRDYLNYYGTQIMGQPQDRGDCPQPEKRTRKQRNQFSGYTSKSKEISIPDQWPEQYHSANGENQSPININFSKVIYVPPGIQKPLAFNKQYFSQPRSMTILNDGHSILLGTCYTNEYPTLSGGPLNYNYRFNLAQFKWGPTNDEGSEHTIDSRRFAMEMQLMHIKGETMYSNLEEAVTQKAVVFLSFLFEVTKQDNPFLSPLVNHLPRITCPNTTYPLEPFPLCWLFQPFRSKYLYYEGSITCPPCTEGVEWLIQTEPLGISNRQLSVFRSIMGFNGPMLSNARPVQKLNNRRVQYFL